MGLLGLFGRRHSLLPAAPVLAAIRRLAWTPMDASIFSALQTETWLKSRPQTILVRPGKINSMSAVFTRSRTLRFRRQLLEIPTGPQFPFMDRQLGPEIPMQPTLPASGISISRTLFM